MEAERAGHSVRIASIQSAEQQLRESFAKLSNEALSASAYQFLTLPWHRSDWSASSRQCVAIPTALFDPFASRLTSNARTPTAV